VSWGVALPTEPMSLDEVLERYPSLRQSLLAKFDDCALSSYFELRYANGWTTHPQARGIIFHRVAAAMIRDMQRFDSMSIAPSDALAHLEEQLEQRGIPPLERVRVPLRELPELRMAVVKFAKDNSFSIRNIVGVEQQMSADLQYRDDAGELRTRTLTGRLDLLVADPTEAKGAIVLDWKDTWALPPNHNANPDRGKATGLSYHGYFQQRFYGWLVLKNFEQLEQVTLREFYPRRTKARKATLQRTDLEKVEKELADLTLELDRALASGAPKKLTFEGVAPWNPQPGKHCHYCVAKLKCPIERDVLSENFAVVSEADARRKTALLKTLDAARDSVREALRPWVEENGAVPVAWSKGRLVFGLRTPKSGSGSPTLTFFTPEDADRPATMTADDKPLAEAIKRATETARKQRA
jgi:hypothetical protein